MAENKFTNYPFNIYSSSKKCHRLFKIKREKKIFYGITKYIYKFVKDRLKEGVKKTH